MHALSACYTLMRGYERLEEAALSYLNLFHMQCSNFTAENIAGNLRSKSYELGEGRGNSSDKIVQLLSMKYLLNLDFACDLVRTLGPVSVTGELNNDF